MRSLIDSKRYPSALTSDRRERWITRIWVRVYEAASYEDLFFSVSMDRRVG